MNPSAGSCRRHLGHFAALPRAPALAPAFSLQKLKSAGDSKESKLLATPDFGDEDVAVAGSGNDFAGDGGSAAAAGDADDDDDIAGHARKMVHADADAAAAVP